MSELKFLVNYPFNISVQYHSVVFLIFFCSKDRFSLLIVLFLYIALPDFDSCGMNSATLIILQYNQGQISCQQMLGNILNVAYMHIGYTTIQKLVVSTFFN